VASLNTLGSFQTLLKQSTLEGEKKETQGPGGGGLKGNRDDSGYAKLQTSFSFLNDLSD